jgi:hypothetical protein
MSDVISDGITQPAICKSCAQTLIPGEPHDCPGSGAIPPAGTSIADAAKLGHTMTSPHDFVAAEAGLCAWCFAPAEHPRHAPAQPVGDPATLDKETAIVAKSLTLQLLSVAGDIAISLDMPESKLDEIKSDERRSSMLSYNKIADADKRLERIANLLALVEVCERIADKAAVRSELK